MAASRLPCGGIEGVGGDGDGVCQTAPILPGDQHGQRGKIEVEREKKKKRIRIKICLYNQLPRDYLT
jgi:hypothetical protein